MKNSCTNLACAARLVRLLKIEGYSAISRTSQCIKSAWIVHGYEWEVHLYPAHFVPESLGFYVVLDLHFLSEPRVCKAVLVCRLVDPSGKLEPAAEKSVLYDPSRLNSVRLMRRNEADTSGYLRGDTLTVQCAITVLELPEPTDVATPSYTLNQNLGELLQSGTGADVTLVVAGESFAAHKNILAARSPVFMAEFFGNMKEKCSKAVEIGDMEAAVLRALLGFIYTDTVPEFENQEGAVTVMAQHLFAAADRYGIDRLKLICVAKLTGGINVETVATTLALAEQHSCSQLKARCVEFILRTPAILDTVLATDGYKHLESSCPLVVIDLLKSARRRMI